MLKKEVQEFGAAMKKNVHVSDIPKKWKKQMHGLKIEVAEGGEEEIEEAWEGVGETWDDIKDSDVV